MKLTWVFVLFTCLGVASIPGCFRSSETPTPPPTVEYEVGPNLTFSGEIGRVSLSREGTVSAPDIDLPEDIPVVEGGTFSLATDSPPGQLVSIRVSSPLAEVRQFYQEQLPALGWQIDSEDSSGATSTINATKNDRTLVIYTDETEAGTEVVLSHR